MSKDCPEGPLLDPEGPLSSKVHSSSICAANLEVKLVLMDDESARTIQIIPYTGISIIPLLTVTW